ncbi:MAG: hypothetical protein KGJ30_16500 [Burkholderiales bacterium]|nr:hypothetical protein [Burkholderiales bacterium]
MRQSLRISIAAATLALAGCGGGDAPPPPGPQYPQNANLWAALGGDAAAPMAVRKVVSDAVNGLLADPMEAPYFSKVVGNTSGDSSQHDTPARLEACLTLQFSALLGGPYSYPGPVSVPQDTANPQPEMCQDMASAHADVGVPGCVFDQFITDLSSVLSTDLMASGFTQAQVGGVLGQIAPTLVGLKTTIVSPQPTYFAPNSAASCAP